MILLQPLEYLFQGLEVSFMGVGVNQEVVNVDDHVLEVAEDSLHQSLKGRRAPQKSHWWSYPVKLSFPGTGESRQWLGFLVQLHLPESRGEIQS